MLDRHLFAATELQLERSSTTVPCPARVSRAARVLDRWQDGRCGAVLFWIDAKLLELPDLGCPPGLRPRA
jgi:hypothetical protein